VRTTEHIAKSASTTKSGLFATLGGLLRGRGSGAPKTGRALRLTLAALASLCALAATLTLTVSPAAAAETDVFEATFGPDGTAASVFGRPGAIAVDQNTGNVYVADVEAGTVEKFNSAHEPEAFTGIAPNIVSGKLTGLPPTEAVAVNSTSHDFYVTGFGSGAVRAYQSDGEPADFTAGPGVGTNEIGGATLCGVAVDSNGDIYAEEDGVGFGVYAPSGELLTKIPQAERFACNLAVDSHGAVYLGYLGGEVEKFIPSKFPVTSSTTYTPAGFVGAGIVSSYAANGVAVDPTSDRLYIDEGSRVSEYDEAGGLLGTFGAAEPGALTGSGGIAVNGATHDVYVEGRQQVEVFGPVPAVTTGKVTEVHPTSVTFNGMVNSNGAEVTGCHFDYGTSTSYGQVAPCEQTVGSGTSEVAVTAKVTGLTAGATYHYRLQATNVTGHTSYGKGEPLAAPLIDEASVTNLSASSVDLDTKIDPEGLATTYRFEYGTSASYGTSIPVPDQDIGESQSEVPVTQHVEELKPNVTYHWRVVATNAFGTTTGSDHTFIYPEAGGGLPDHRAYELVTPPQKNGALVGDAPFAVPPDISENGSRLISVAIQCFGNALSCTPVRGFPLVGVPYEFSRTANGWVTNALAPPASEFEEDTTLLYSAETGTTWFSAPTPPDYEDDFYAREPGGSIVDIGPMTSPAAGRATLETLQEISTSLFEGTANLSHVAFGRARGTFFEYTHAGSTEPIPVGVSGLGATNTELISACYTEGGGPPGGMSADGQIVYFLSDPCSTGTGANAGKPVPTKELFARIDNGEPGAHTVSVSEPQQLSSAEPDDECSQGTGCLEDIVNTANWSAAEFIAASSDGSKVLFSSEQRLTDEATQGANNLYLYDLDLPVGHRLIDVSAGSGGGGPQLRKAIAFSSDGSHVYFVAQGVLSSAPSTDAQGRGPHGELVSSGAVAQIGEDNLYVFDTATHRTSFIATVPPSDSESWRLDEPANVTPDGRFLVFTSKGRLTADDTRTDGSEQVFDYDAETGQLVRISIGENGFNDDGNASTGSAQIVGGTSGMGRLGPARVDPTMSNDGAYVFFMSPVALTRGGLNDVRIGTGEREGKVVPEYAENVYEYHEGNVYLISDGHDMNAGSSAACEPSVSTTCLIGSDASGSNVFFTSADPLVPADTDPQQLNVYDARICEPENGNPCIQPAPQPPPPCLGEACHGIPPAIPSALTPGSASFNGAGDLAPGPAPAVKLRSSTRAQKLAAALRACRKDRKKGRRARCEKQARKSYGPPKAGKASYDRRAGR
jgi:hypothetical protein